MPGVVSGSYAHQTTNTPYSDDANDYPPTLSISSKKTTAIRRICCHSFVGLFSFAKAKENKKPRQFQRGSLFSGDG